MMALNNRDVYVGITEVDFKDCGAMCRLGLARQGEMVLFYLNG